MVASWSSQARTRRVITTIFYCISSEAGSLAVLLATEAAGRATGTVGGLAPRRDRRGGEAVVKIIDSVAVVFAAEITNRDAVFVAREHTDGFASVVVVELTGGISVFIAGERIDEAAVVVAVDLTDGVAAVGTVKLTGGVAVVDTGEITDIAAGVVIVELTDEPAVVAPGSPQGVAEATGSRSKETNKIEMRGSPCLVRRKAT